MTAGRNTSPGLRRDIQGLRALAVIVVVLDHLLHWPRGGFIGVDIFFVISGFLITGILLREHERTGRISFVNFYKRRAKRILPASALVLLVTLIASYFVFSQSRFLSILGDTVSALFFAGNWRFAAAGTDYFQSGVPVSPLQHFWSLAVEEQFYFAWPWLMLGIFALLAGRSLQRHSRLAVGGAITVVSVASFTWSLYETSNAPTVAYFSTFSRSWELGIGALLAVIAPALGSIPKILRPALAWAGMVGMIASLFVIDGTMLFPAPTAALPVLSAALVILAGTGTSMHNYLWPITNRVSGYLGDISYSLYLWHFPVIIILGAFMEESPVYYVAAAGTSLAIAAYAYHLVENPVRNSNWLSGRSIGHGESRPFTKSHQLIALSLLAAVTACVTIFALLPPRVPTAVVSAPMPKPSAVADANGTATSPGVRQVQSQIAAALNSENWPEGLAPSLDDPNSGIAAEMGAGCLNPADLANTEVCTSGKGAKTAMVIGDSVAASWAPAVRGALEGRGWAVHTVAYSGCPFLQTTIAIDNKPDLTQKCNESKPGIAAQIESLRPELVILSSAQSGFNYLGSGSEGPEAIVEWTQGLVGSISVAKAVGAQVAVLASNPEGKAVTECATRSSVPSDCASTISGGWFQKAEAEKTAAAEAGAVFIDPRPWLCAPNDVCPMYIGDKLVRWDSVHLTEPFTLAIAPLLLEALEPLLQN